MTDIKIDKGIPFNPRNKWPFATMEIGDSFLAPASLKKSYLATLASGASRQYAPKRFASRKTPAGFRVWRVA